MLFLKILGIIFLVIAVILVLAYIFMPGLIVLLYSQVIKFFVNNPPFVDKDKLFPQSKLIKDNWAVIREELDEILKHKEHVPKFHEVDGIQKFISAQDDIPWRTFVLKGFGVTVEGNAKLAPRTYKLVQQIPDVTLAMFSILEGGKHIPRHFGFFKGLYRYHLAMKVPTEGECYILVGGQRYDWIQGEDVLFDDTYMHEVWNKSSQQRVVLFCDVLRDQDLPAWVRPINKWMFNLLANSNRIKKAAKKAELPKDLDVAASANV